MLATITALLLSILCLPLFRQLADKEISAAPLTNPLVLGALVAGALLIGLAAGSYPALVLSRFRPSSVLKGSFATSRRGAALRQTLVVFQFATAIALIVGTLVVRQQLGYMQGRPLGFENEQQLLLDFGGDSVVRENIESIKNELASTPGIQSIAATRSVPGGYFPDAGTDLEAPEGMRKVVLGLFEVDTDFLPQIGATAVAGRLFSREISSDADQALVLNEAAVAELGYPDPAEAVGKRFQQWGREGVIIGVVKDFNYESLHHEIRPLSFRVSPWVGLLVLQVSTDDAADVIDALRERWGTLAPHRPFLFSFLDQNFDALYRSEDRFAALFGTFAALAIFVACLGLFGLAAFSAQQRTKEIGVRKVMGATVGSVTGLLSKEFLKLVLIGFILAVPAAYLGMSRWLEGFAYRIELGWEIFLLAGIITLVVALSTVSYQAVKAAMSDPVVSLRYE
jgi:putative ABC transport system permease protein